MKLPKVFKKIDWLLVIAAIVLVALNFTGPGRQFQDIALQEYHTLYYGVGIPLIALTVGGWTYQRFKKVFKGGK